MDFIIGFLKVQGRDCVYVVVDRLSKFVHLFSIPLKSSASHVVDIFFREVFRLHGLPRYIVSERDNGFINAFSQELFRLSRT